jgi:hypothetical protein
MNIIFLKQETVKPGDFQILSLVDHLSRHVGMQDSFVHIYFRAQRPETNQGTSFAKYEVDRTRTSGIVLPIVIEISAFTLDHFAQS